MDLIYALTESKDTAAHWYKLKQRLKEKGNQSVTNCHALKMLEEKSKPKAYKKIKKPNAKAAKSLNKLMKTLKEDGYSVLFCPRKDIAVILQQKANVTSKTINE